MEREPKDSEQNKPSYPEGIADEVRAIMDQIWNRMQARKLTAEPDPEKPQITTVWQKLERCGYRRNVLAELGNMTSGTAYDCAARLHRTKDSVILLTGASGTGKTSIAATLALWRLKQSKFAGQYTTLYALAQGFKNNFHSGSDDAQRAMVRSRWLVIDDIHRGPAWAISELENLVIERQENGVTTMLIGPHGHHRKLADQITTRAAHTEVSWTPFR